SEVIVLHEKITERRMPYACRTVRFRPGKELADGVQRINDMRIRALLPRHFGQGARDLPDGQPVTTRPRQQAQDRPYLAAPFFVEAIVGDFAGKIVAVQGPEPGWHPDLGGIRDRRLAAQQVTSNVEGVEEVLPARFGDPVREPAAGHRGSP